MTLLDPDYRSMRVSCGSLFMAKGECVEVGEVCSCAVGRLRIQVLYCTVREQVRTTEDLGEARASTTTAARIRRSPHPIDFPHLHFHNRRPQSSFGARLLPELVSSRTSETLRVAYAKLSRCSREALRSRDHSLNDSRHLPPPERLYCSFGQPLRSQARHLVPNKVQQVVGRSTSMTQTWTLEWCGTPMAELVFR